MQTLTQIEKILSDYNNLIPFVKEKTKLLEKLDPNEYDTARGIIEVYFDEDGVNVKCDDSSWGCYDTSTINFPLRYLVLSDDDLKKEIEQKKEERLEKQRQAEIKLKTEKREKELAEYNRLKEKFAPPIINTENPFKIDQNVGMVDEGDGRQVRSKVVDVRNNRVTVKWEDMFDPCEHYKSEFKSIKIYE